MSQEKVTRRPYTDEQKIARRLAYQQSKNKNLTAILNRSKLEDFALKFVSWLMMAYDEAERTNLLKQSPYDRVKFTKVGESIMLELSLTWLRKEYGSKSVDAFKRLFVQVQAGGRTRATAEAPSVSYDTIWVKNDEAYPRFRQSIVAIFKRNGKVTAADVWGILESETAYKFAATRHFTFVDEDGKHRVAPDKRSKQVMPLEAFNVVKVRRLALKAEVKQLNKGETV